MVAVSSGLGVQNREIKPMKGIAYALSNHSSTPPISHVRLGGQFRSLTSCSPHSHAPTLSGRMPQTTPLLLFLSILLCSPERTLSSSTLPSCSPGRTPDHSLTTFTDHSFSPGRTPDHSCFTWKARTYSSCSLGSVSHAGAAAMNV